ncbi:hypothetical protein N9A64_01360 [Pseudomonadales bacterium]|nr:hypothetical protein [Pseudomonadales bacterium]
MDLARSATYAGFQGLSLKEKLNFLLLLLIGISMILSCAGYYLLPSSQANNFPTFLLALSMIVYVALDAKSIEIFDHRGLVKALVLLLFYMATTGFWFYDGHLLQVLKLYADSFLILLFIFSLIVLLRKAKNFLYLLVATIVLAATSSALEWLYLTMISDDIARAVGRLQYPALAAISWGFAVFPAMWLSAISRISIVKMLWAIAGLFLAAVALYQKIVYVQIALSIATAFMGYFYAKVLWSGDRPKIFLIACIVSFFVLSLFLSDSLNQIQQDRPTIWNQSVQHLFDVPGKPLFGFGLMGDTTMSLPCELHFAGEVCHFSHPHSLFVSTLVYGGIIGLFLLFTLLIWTTNILVSEMHQRQAQLALFILGYAIPLLLFDGDRLIDKIDIIWLLLWFPVGIALSIKPQTHGRDATLNPQ